MDGEPKMELDTGNQSTVGERVGEIKVFIFKSGHFNMKRGDHTQGIESIGESS